jgi:hypothetical protein
MKQLRSVTRARLVRAYVSATLSSEITNQELMALADELAHGRFAHDLSDILRSVGKSFQARLKDADSDAVESAVDDASTTIKARRLSKQRVFQLMQIVDEDAAPDETTLSQPLPTMLRRFFRLTPESSAQNFLNLLSKGAASDEYLNLIDRTKR